jgi:hypothetical protein
MNKCLVTELYSQFSGKKLPINLATTQLVKDIENISTEILQMIKTSNQRLGLGCANPNAETQEI